MSIAMVMASSLCPRSISRSSMMDSCARRALLREVMCVLALLTVASIILLPWSRRNSKAIVHGALFEMRKLPVKDRKVCGAWIEVSKMLPFPHISFWHVQQLLIHVGPPGYIFNHPRTSIKSNIHRSSHPKARAMTPAVVAHVPP